MPDGSGSDPQDPEQLQETANQILTAIIQGMRKEEPSNNVKLAATNALLNSLEFTRANFDKEVQNQNQNRSLLLRCVSGTLTCVCVFRRRDISSCRWCVKPRSVPTPE